MSFRESSWDVKRLFRLIVSSRTYRQSAQVTPEKLELDPDNILMSRGPRFRMDAEMVRDYALKVSDTLSAEMGGPARGPISRKGFGMSSACRAGTPGTTCKTPVKTFIDAPCTLLEAHGAVA